MGFLDKWFGRGKSASDAKALAKASQLGGQLAEYRRSAWLPVTEAGDGSNSDSKFSGMAFIPQGERWPRCGHCDQPMQLFAQLNSAQLPEDARELLPSGILQLFYCTNETLECEIECDAFFGFSKAHLARVVPAGPGEDIAAHPVADAFPARRIVGWESVVDLPNSEEAGQLGVSMTEQQAEDLANVGIPRGGEKLGGWPCWVQASSIRIARSASSRWRCCCKWIRIRTCRTCWGTWVSAMSRVAPVTRKF